MTTYQPRQPKGIPVGGQYATAQRGAAGLSLAGPLSATRDAEIEKFFGDAERHQAILDGGYVPASVVPALTDPRYTTGRGVWWGQAYAAAEHGVDDATYPIMPDDYTPSKRAGASLGGRSALGNLRTYRTKWTDDGITFRMPSKNAVKAFAAETGSTFRVPFSALDEKSGRAIETEVLVTSLGNGAWSVDCNSLSGSTKAMVCEAITARLERRRRSLAPKVTGEVLDKCRDSSGQVRDLLARATAREAASGAAVAATDHRSQWISAVGYNEASGVMFTETSNGNTYGHHVSVDDFEAVRTGKSPGAMFNTLVKGSPRAEVSRCGQCSRVYAVVNGHACKVAPKAPAPGPKPSNTVARQVAASVSKNVLPKVARRKVSA